MTKSDEACLESWDPYGIFSKIEESAEKKCLKIDGVSGSQINVSEWHLKMV